MYTCGFLGNKIVQRIISFKYESIYGIKSKQLFVDKQWTIIHVLLDYVISWNWFLESE